MSKAARHPRPRFHLNSPASRRAHRRLIATCEPYAEATAIMDRCARMRHRERGRWAVTDGWIYFRHRSKSRAQAQARRFKHGARVMRHSHSAMLRVFDRTHVWEETP